MIQLGTPLPFHDGCMRETRNTWQATTGVVGPQNFAGRWTRGGGGGGHDRLPSASSLPCRLSSLPCGPQTPGNMTRAPVGGRTVETRRKKAAPQKSPAHRATSSQGQWDCVAAVSAKLGPSGFCLIGLLLLSVPTAWTWPPWRVAEPAVQGDSSAACRAFSTLKSSNPYVLLGVARDANPTAITKSYRALSRKLHPDKNSCGYTPDVGKAAFAALSVAYGVLSNPEKREIFDRLGDEGLRRLQDGDPRIKKGYLPPDEILRRAATKNGPR